MNENSGRLLKRDKRRRPYLKCCFSNPKAAFFSFPPPPSAVLVDGSRRRHRRVQFQREAVLSYIPRFIYATVHATNTHIKYTGIERERERETVTRLIILQLTSCLPASSPPRPRPRLVDGVNYTAAAAVKRRQSAASSASPLQQSNQPELSRRKPKPKPPLEKRFNIFKIP